MIFFNRKFYYIIGIIHFNSKMIKKPNENQFNELLMPYKIKNFRAFSNYLVETWKDLKKEPKRKNSSHKDIFHCISRKTFTKYMKLPNKISKRIFYAFDTNLDGYLHFKEFLTGMLSLFCEDLQSALKLIFAIYDSDKDNYIQKEDIREVMTTIIKPPQNTNSPTYIFDINNRTTNNKKKKESTLVMNDLNNSNDHIKYVSYFERDEIEELINRYFLNNTINLKSKRNSGKLNVEKIGLSYDDFIKAVVEDGLEEIFTHLFIFIMENKPFNNTTVGCYVNSNSHKNKLKSQSPPLSPVKIPLGMSSQNLNVNVYPSNVNVFSNSPSKLMESLNCSKQIVYSFREDNSYNINNVMNKVEITNTSSNNINTNDNNTIKDNECKKRKNKMGRFSKIECIKRNEKHHGGILINSFGENGIDECTFSYRSHSYSSEHFSNNNLITQIEQSLDLPQPKRRQVKNLNRVTDASLNDSKNLLDNINNNTLLTETKTISTSVYSIQDYGGASEVLTTPKNSNNNHISNQNDVPCYEGYMFKITKTRKIQRLWFKLYQHELFYFKRKNDPVFQGKHYITGVNIIENEFILINNILLYSFTIVFPKQQRQYYLNDLNEYKNWLHELRKASDEFPLSTKYELGPVIAQGKHGLLRIGRHKENGKKTAIKIINKKEMKKEDIEHIKNEINILKIVQHHPHIVKLIELHENEETITIVTEYHNGTDLFTYISNIHNAKFKLPESQVATIIYQLALAIEFIHSFGIIHRDIRPECILITTNEKKIKVCLHDFGYCKILQPDELCQEQIGALSYVAPEILIGKKYDYKVDIWSLGCVAFLLLSGVLPFDDEHSELEIKRKTIQNELKFNKSVWKGVSKEAKDFVKGMLNKKSEKRIDIQKALKHKWIQRYCKKDEKHNDVLKGCFRFYSLISSKKIDV